ncbi:MAG: GTP 3',8-cyclase MoaA [Spirosomataceae bacterium]
MLFDNHGRPIQYVRLAVTDRCNLRCFYCMPAEGIQFLKKKEILSYEEILRLLRVMASLGISKVRLTGGEPFIRKDFMSLVEQISVLEGIQHIHLTTNGTLTAPFIPQLKSLGIRSVNLSLDSLDRHAFYTMTRRDELPLVLETFHQLIEAEIPTKINAVVMAGKNEDQIIPLAQLAQQFPVSVRFIEEMPFNGQGGNDSFLSHTRILAKLKEAFPDLTSLPMEPFGTANRYQVPGFQGELGIIAAFSRTFCGTCNRIRVTATGQLKTCLYDEGVGSIRDVMRSQPDDDALRNFLLFHLNHRPKDGFEAEQNRTSLVTESMTTIGG